jgi:hypothetical protein
MRASYAVPPTRNPKPVPTICVIMDVWSVSTTKRGVSVMGNVEDRERTPDEESDEWDDGSGEALEELIEHADRASGAESFGTTVDEQERGEPLGERLAEEATDRPIRDTDLGLIDEGGPDEEDELVGEAVGERDPFVAPEESAMSVRDEAPGAVDHPDDHTDGDEADPSTE